VAEAGRQGALGGARGSRVGFRGAATGGAEVPEGFMLPSLHEIGTFHGDSCWSPLVFRLIGSVVSGVAI
jgi:hypothetical protein